MEKQAETQENANKGVIEMLYRALAQGDTGTVATLLPSDLEWWFHGPPERDHMMRVLTGKSLHTEFQFVPRSITAIEEDNKVIVEGWEGAQVYWVHVWTVNKEGLVITQLREYFNTLLTVRDLRRIPAQWELQVIRAHDEQDTVRWQSEPREHLTRSLPGLVLAI